MTTWQDKLVVVVAGRQEGIFGRVVQDLSALPRKKKSKDGLIEIQYSAPAGERQAKTAWYQAGSLGDGSAHEQAFKDAQASGELYRLKGETSSSDDDSEVSPPATQPHPRSTRGKAPPPKPEDPPPGLLRQGTNFASLSADTVEKYLLGNEAKRQKKARSYIQTLRSSDATASSIDALSKTEIEKKLTKCVEAYWKTYDEAMEKF